MAALLFPSENKFFSFHVLFFLIQEEYWDGLLYVDQE